MPVSVGFKYCEVVYFVLLRFGEVGGGDEYSETKSVNNIFHAFIGNIRAPAAGESVGLDEAFVVGFKFLHAGAIKIGGRRAMYCDVDIDVTVTAINGVTLCHV